MEDLPDLEAKLTAYLQSEGLNELRAGGYKVELTGGEIKLSKAEKKDVDLDQLEFKFERDQKNERSDQIERQITGS